MDEKIRRACCDLQGSGVGDGAAGVVRAKRDMASLGHGGDFLELADAAAMGDVALDEIGTAHIEETRCLPTAVESFAGSDGHAAALLHFEQGIEVVRRHGFLEPEDIKRLERAGDAHGGGNVESAMTFDQQIDLVADSIFHGRDVFDGKPQVGF